MKFQRRTVTKILKNNIKPSTSSRFTKCLERNFNVQRTLKNSQVYPKPSLPSRHSLGFVTRLRNLGQNLMLPFQAHSQDFLWEDATEASVDQTIEVYLLIV